MKILTLSPFVKVRSRERMVPLLTFSHKMTLCIIILLVASLIGVSADDSNASQIKSLERRLLELEHEQQRLASDEYRDVIEVKSRLEKIEEDIESAGFGLFVSGVLCALWAQ